MNARTRLVASAGLGAAVTTALVMGVIASGAAALADRVGAPLPASAVVVPSSAPSSASSPAPAGPNAPVPRAAQAPANAQTVTTVPAPAPVNLRPADQSARREAASTQAPAQTGTGSHADRPGTAERPGADGADQDGHRPTASVPPADLHADSATDAEDVHAAEDERGDGDDDSHGRRPGAGDPGAGTHRQSWHLRGPHRGQWPDQPQR